jgi:hypothetical protein
MNWRNFQNLIGSRDYNDPLREKNARDCIPRDPDLENCRGQWWPHTPDLEYLAANPVHIPGLPTILQSVRITSSHGLGEQVGAFDITEKDLRYRNSPESDPFSDLPSELRWAILDLLDPLSIASLRLTSRAFRQLPQWVFYRLLRREFPSLWEISQSSDGDPSPYFWNALKAREIEDYIDNPEGPTAAQKEFFENIELYRRVILQDMPELYNAWVKAEPSYREYANQPPWPPAVTGYLKLERGAADWYRLYCRLVKELKKGELKGLKNRERIWKDVTFIMDKIVKCRDEGYIP